MESRKLKIDTLRGIACLLLVAYHVIGSNPASGLKIAEGPYRELNDLLGYMRMPLFTFLSGIVYAYRPFRTGHADFLSKKARRLLLPMLTVGTLFALLQAVIPGTNSRVEHWYLLHINPIAHFWFIESLFILFVLIVLFETLKLFDDGMRFLLVFCAMSALYLSDIGTNYFSVSGFIYLAPYFLLGMAVQRYEWLKHIPGLAGSLFVLCVIAAFILAYAGWLPIFEKRSLPGLIMGLSSCLALLLIGPELKLLARIGVFSYSIYIFHVFFTAGTRILLNKVEVSQLELVLLASVLMGVLGPILVERVLGQANFTRVAFLGKSPIRVRTTAVAEPGQ